MLLTTAWGEWKFTPWIRIISIIHQYGPQEFNYTLFTIVRWFFRNSTFYTYNLFSLLVFLFVILFRAHFDYQKWQFLCSFPSSCIYRLFLCHTTRLAPTTNESSPPVRSHGSKNFWSIFFLDWIGPVISKNQTEQ